MVNRRAISRNGFIAIAVLFCAALFAIVFSEQTFACTVNGGGCYGSDGASSSGGNPNAVLSTRSVGVVSISVADIRAGLVPNAHMNADGSVTFNGVHTAHTNISSTTYPAAEVGGASHIMVYGAIAQHSGNVNGVHYEAGQLITPVGFGNSSDPAWRLSEMQGYARESPYSLGVNTMKQVYYNLMQQGRISPDQYQNFMRGGNISMVAYWDGMTAIGDSSLPPFPPVFPPTFPPDEPETPVTIVPPTPPEPGMGPGCHDGLNAGYTTGSVRINNLSDASQGGWVEGQIWGRPGDSIRFAIDYCWGAQAVTGASGSSQSGWPDLYGGEREKNYFQIDASPSQLYWFGDHSIQAGTRYTYAGGRPISNAYEAFPGAGYFDKTGDYQFQLFSPSNRTANGYSCQIFDFTPYFVAFGFQIPGATTQCPASSRTGNGSGWQDVGSEISQRLTYDDIRAWRAYRMYNNWGVCGGCSWEEGGCRGSASREKDISEYNALNLQNINYGAPHGSYDEAYNGGTDFGVAEQYGDNAFHEHACLDQGSCAPDPNSYKQQYKTTCTRSVFAGYDFFGQAMYDTEEYECVKTKSCSPCDDCVDGYCPYPTSNLGRVYNSPTYDYNHLSENKGTVTKQASVKIPFSFMTSADSGIVGHSNGVVYLGEEVSSHFDVTILPRSHSDVHPGEAYATIVPGEIKAVEFIAREDTGMNDMSGSSDAGGSDPCAFYSGYMLDPSECYTIWSVGSPLNPDGLYSGYSYGTVVDNRNVPDLEKYPVGSKYCVAVGVSTSDSHSDPDNPSPVSGMSSLSGWRISGASCRTIAKRPSFQVWNGGVYTNGSISTINAFKDVGEGLGHHNDPTSIFGSWAEYYVIAAGEISGYSSGAADGYYGYQGNSLGLKGGASIDKEPCDMTRMTIANDECSKEIFGKSGIHNLSQDIILERVRSRYTDGSIEGTSATGNLLSNGARYVKVKGDYNLSTFITAIANSSDAAERNCLFTAGSNSNLALRRCKGTINSQSQQTTSNYASNTLVIHVSGTLTIDRNICNGNGDCNTDNNTIRLGDSNNEFFSNIYSLPQVLLIADGGVRITNNVNQIDAWIITNGNVNTCTGFTVGSGSERDCKSTLIVNGPVFARSMTLNRTGGAYPNVGNYGTDDVLRKDISGTSEINRWGGVSSKGDNRNGSVISAEIFNLRPDVYYWAYSQAQRFSQASVTYTRELAPRY